MAEKQPTISTPEEWRPVPGFEGSYEVSDWGRVRSIDRIVTNKAGIKRRLRGRILTPTADRRGYLQVNLGRGKARRVHRLVASAFIGPCPENMVTCHNNGNPSDNRVENLRFDTHSGNQLDSVRHGTHYLASRTHCPSGHALAAPNLVPSELRRGWRKCWACDRARDYLRYRPELTHDFQRISNDYYRSIMAQQAVDDHLDAA